MGIGQANTCLFEELTKMLFRLLLFWHKVIFGKYLLYFFGVCWDEKIIVNKKYFRFERKSWSGLVGTWSGLHRNLVETPPEYGRDSLRTGWEPLGFSWDFVGPSSQTTAGT